VVGSESLLNEAEFIAIYFEVLQKLGLKDFNIKINNRKVLAGIADVLNRSDLLIDMTVAIDKLDKIGVSGVKKELIERGFTEDNVEKLSPILQSSGSTDDQLALLKRFLEGSSIGNKGIEEIEEVITYVAILDAEILNKLQLDITL